VAYDEGLGFASQFEMKFAEVSAKTGNGVSEAIHTLSEEILNKKFKH